MVSMRYSRRFALEPLAKGPPEALVVLLLDLGSCRKILCPVAARWATAVPGAAFLALDCQILLSCGERASPDEAATGSDRLMLDYATRLLEPSLALELGSRRLDPTRLVLVGFGFGARLALHLLLGRGVSYAGALCRARRNCAGRGNTCRDPLRSRVALLTTRTLVSGVTPIRTPRA